MSIASSVELKVARTPEENMSGAESEERKRTG